MAATIVVTPEWLRHAAAAARALGARLLGVRGQLGASLHGMDAALGEGEAQAAFATLWARWSGSAERLQAAVDDLAAALEAAADGYERADRAGARSPALPAVPPSAVEPPGTSAAPAGEGARGGLGGGGSRLPGTPAAPAGGEGSGGSLGGGSRATPG
jgi:WXG100 family type VII secretion target